MPRAVDSEESALWAKVIETVRPLDRSPRVQGEDGPTLQRPPRPVRATPAPVERRSAAGPGTTLDGGWDKRLARGSVIPDRTVDLHGHSLSRAYDRLDRALGEAIASEARVLLLITGHPPTGEPPIRRGAIRGVVGDWLAASCHAGHIAAVRPAHPRHGGRGALYIVLRRKR